MSFYDQHFARINKFINTFQSTRNVHIRYIGERARVSVSGALGRNYVRCTHGNQRSAAPRGDLLIRSDTIRELLDARDGM